MSSAFPRTAKCKDGHCCYPVLRLPAQARPIEPWQNIEILARTARGKGCKLGSIIIQLAEIAVGITIFSVWKSTL